MKQFLLSAFWAITVAVNSGTTSVNVNMPESSFDALLSTVQTLTNNTALWNSNFFSQLLLLF